MYKTSGGSFQREDEKNDGWKEINRERETSDNKNKYLDGQGEMKGKKLESIKEKARSQFLW